MELGLVSTCPATRMPPRGVPEPMTRPLHERPSGSTQLPSSLSEWHDMPISVKDSHVSLDRSLASSSNTDCKVVCIRSEAHHGFLFVHTVKEFLQLAPERRTEDCAVQCASLPHTSRGAVLELTVLRSVAVPSLTHCEGAQRGKTGNVLRRISQHSQTVD